MYKPNTEVHRFSFHEEKETIVATHRRGTEEIGKMGPEIIRVAVHRFETAPANTTVGVKRTINLEKYDSLLRYESTTIEIRRTVPCYVEDLAEVEEATLRAVIKKVTKEEEDVVDGIRQRRNARNGA